MRLDKSVYQSGVTGSMKAHLNVAGVAQALLSILKSKTYDMAFMESEKVIRQTIDHPLL